MNTEFTVKLPEWLIKTQRQTTTPFLTPEAKMTFVCNIAKQNILQKTGGPFGAAIFDAQGNLISAGVNLVESNNCSILHAEMVAIAFAQKALNRYDLSNSGQAYFELVSSTEPCAMCFGAIPWSGVRHVICGARDADARAIGFDEGPKLTNWQEALAERHITVACDVLRADAVNILTLYTTLGGTIYNAGS